MACLLGTLDGTDVLIRIFDETNDIWHYVKGEVNNTLTFTSQPIDITNKYSNSFRCIKEGAGLKTSSLSGEFIWNDDVGFLYAKSVFLEQNITKFQLIRGEADDDGTVFEFSGYITNWTETAPDNDKLTVNMAIESSDEFGQGTTSGLFFSFDGVNFFTSNNQRFYVRD